MPGRSVGILLAAVLTVTAAACSADPTTGDGGGSTTASSEAAATIPPRTTPGGGTVDPSVPIVDPASAEAFCALSSQLEQLADEQLGDANPADPEAFRQDMAAFVTDNAAVIDQYVAAAPPEVEADVAAATEQTRAAVDDPELFAELLAGTGDTAASDRVSAFIDANCAA